MSGPILKKHQKARESSQLFSGQLSPGLRRAVRNASEETKKAILGGKPQWSSHDGKGAQARRARQRKAAEMKASKKLLGVAVDPATGMTPGGIIIPGMEPKDSESPE